MSWLNKPFSLFVLLALLGSTAATSDSGARFRKNPAYKFEIAPWDRAPWDAYARTLKRLEKASGSEACDFEAQGFTCTKPFGNGVNALPQFHTLYPSILDRTRLAYLSQSRREQSLDYKAALGETGGELRELRTWAPSSAVKDASYLLETWSRMAKSGELYACDKVSCRFITYATNNDRVKFPTLIQCDVDPSFSEMVPPSICEPLVVFAQGETWMVVLESPRLLGSGGWTPFGPSYDYLVLAEKKITNKVLMAALQRVLTGDPLSLTLMRTPESDHKLVGTAEFRVSPVLNDGYRELVSVEIAVTEDCQDPKPAFCLNLRPQLVVNRQNTDAPTDWHLPTDRQRNKYQKAVESKIGEQLGQLCTGGRWRDESTYVCRGRD